MGGIGRLGDMLHLCHISDLLYLYELSESTLNNADMFRLISTVSC